MQEYVKIPKIEFDKLEEVRLQLHRMNLTEQQKIQLAMCTGVLYSIANRKWEVIIE